MMVAACILNVIIGADALLYQPLVRWLMFADLRKHAWSFCLYGPGLAPDLLDLLCSQPDCHGSCDARDSS